METSSCFKTYFRGLHHIERELMSMSSISKYSFIVVFIFGATISIIVTICPKFSELLWIPSKQLSTRNTIQAEVNRLHESNIPHIGSYSAVGLAFNKHNSNGDLKGEALASLKLALEMKEDGKEEKALKLFEHAIALDPLHADILNAYGEFLEYRQNDIVQAESMYSKALVVSPTHTKALTNKQRTLPLVEDIDQKYFNKIDRKREMFYKIPDSHPGLRRAKKESYYQHIYHTTAIEGNTMTLSQTRSIIETRLAVGGKSLHEHNEILGMDAALSYINNTLTQRIGAITLQDILDIHKLVLGYTDPMEAGRIRNTQVFVGEYVAPSPNDVRKLMEEFVIWLNSEESLSLHPIEFSALAHYKLVFIHPFFDGNGRTARLLMNLILMQAGFPPVIVRVEDRHLYYKHLETGNAGDIRPFIRFIAKCTERTLEGFIIASSENTQVSRHELTSNHYNDNGRTIIVE